MDKFVRVKVKTGARKEVIRSVGRAGERRYEISVKEKPAQNAANRRVIEILARELGVGEKRIGFVSGQRSTSKIFEIRS